MCTRSTGMTFSPEMAPDPRWFEFLWELGEMAARGGDIRHRLFGSPSALD